MSCESCKQWSDEYNELSKEFQLYREQQEEKIIMLQDSLESWKQEYYFLVETSQGYKRRIQELEGG